MLQQFYPQPFPHSYPYELNKDIHFASAHFIPSQSAGKCQNVHGHTYHVNLTIGGFSLDESNFLVNFADLKHLVEKKFDHKTLNEFVEFPSTEAMAKFISDIVQEHLNTLENNPVVLQVVLRETPESYVVYRPKGE